MTDPGGSAGTVTCPNGHQSVATDYCDVCGEPLAAVLAGGAGGGAGAGAGVGAGAAGGAPTGSAPTGSASTGPASQTCPNCQTENVADALFCEACGYDFTTGAMPRVPAPASSLDLGAPDASPAGPASPAGSASPTPLAPRVPLEWVTEIWVDPDWYAEQDSTEPCPSPGLPAIVPLTVRSVLIGRVSKSRNIHPEIDCDGDIGVSRRQAQLTTDGTRWWVEDLQSSNGTYVGPDSGPLPTVPLTPGQRRELSEGDRVYVGAWTRIVVRRATDEEKAGAA
ncbi:FHA domain-containing protein [Pengzhenrongella sicca]|uniref:FHA domain-containing protein n=1 Tax=Pengzhenrongella sicca TaxID=2819238 RepID=A0A8A4ZMP9_9MICO|nr:FHA domain-containing protein [Pengzhenrongella sicca]QTE30838.1 FHA domain-containing protein [Pengzhenrongella sicca]